MSGSDARPILITGGAGFIGSNLADRLAQEGETVVIYDGLRRPGVERNLAWLQVRHGERIRPLIADVRDTAKLSEAVHGARAVFHFAAQVAVTTSLTDPISDFDIRVQRFRARPITMHLLQQRVEHSNPMPSAQKLGGNLTSDEPCAARNEHQFCHVDAFPV